MATASNSKFAQSSFNFFLRFTSQDDSFNVNLAIFLSHLRSYSQREDVSIDRTTVDMLSEAVYTIDRIVSGTKPKPPTENDAVEFIFNLEPEFYKIRPYIACRLCSVSRLPNKLIISWKSKKNHSFCHFFRIV